MKKEDIEMIKTALRVADKHLTDEGYKPIKSVKKAIEIINKEKPAGSLTIEMEHLFRSFIRINHLSKEWDLFLSKEEK